MSTKKETPGQMDGVFSFVNYTNTQMAVSAWSPAVSRKLAVEFFREENWTKVDLKKFGCLEACPGDLDGFFGMLLRLVYFFSLSLVLGGI